jgi:formylglycine-generating enzyme required for sulfatase activity
MDSDYEGTREIRDLQPGQCVGRFQLVRVLGQGGFGVAWLAVDPEKQDEFRAGEVVLKFLHAEYRWQREVVAEFRRSYRVVQSLTHQSICPLYDLGEDGRFGVFQVMAFVPGQTLTQYLQQQVPGGQGLELSEVVRWLRPVAEALDFAHGKGIVHRDIKPDNLMVNELTGEVSVLDFGLAADLQRSLARLPSQPVRPVRGTPCYMSPEQWKCLTEQQNGAMDQYSLAVVAWQMLVGAVPWGGAPEVVRAAVLNDPIPSLPDRLGHLQSVFERAMAKDWRDRYECVVGFVEALAVGGPGQSVVNRPLTAQLQERRQALSRAHAQARQLQQLGQYAGAVAVLDGLDPALWGQRDEHLYAECCASRDRVLQLRQQVEAAVQKLELQNLGSVVAELVRLEPEEGEWVRLLEELSEVTESQCKAALSSQVAAAESQALATGSAVHSAVPAEGSPQLTAGATVSDPPSAAAHGGRRNFLRAGLWAGGVGLAGIGLVALQKYQQEQQVQRELKQLIQMLALQNMEASRLKLPVEFTNPLGMAFRLIPAGTFLMGSPPGVGNSDEQPQHQVTLSRAFYLGQTTVTQGHWQQLMGTAPWRGQAYVLEGPEIAATYVEWNDAVKFCERISEREGRVYRLPTEAEWEYACRAGTTTAYSFGDEEGQLGRHEWYDGNADSVGEQYAHAVGKKKQNFFGLYDMHGNVWEWVQDWYDEEYYAKSPRVDPTGPGSGSSHALRGGSWDNASLCVRSGFRGAYSPDVRYFSVGLRLCVEL